MEALEDRPELWAENAVAYGAFWELSPERVVGFGEGYIPRAVIRQYAQDEDLPFDEVFRKVRVLDSAYLKHRKEAAERDEAAKAGKAGRQPATAGGRGR